MPIVSDAFYQRDVIITLITFCGVDREYIESLIDQYQYSELLYVKYGLQAIVHYARIYAASKGIEFLVPWSDIG